MLKQFVFALLLPISFAVIAADPIDINYEIQRTDARFRLFKTTNIWNFLELDTQTGRVWQVQFSVGEKDERMKLEIRPELAATVGKPGRFTLYPTRNMYNFILLDQDTGKTWQVQWGTGKEQSSWAIDEINKKTNSEWKQ